MARNASLAGNATDRPSTYNRIHVILAGLASLVVFAIGVDTLQYLEENANSRHLQQFRAKTFSDLARVRSGAEIAINKRVYLTLGLRAHVTTNPEISQADFENIARIISRQSDGIRSVTLLRDNVITGVYPIEGNEKAIGFEPLKDPAQRDAILQAMRAEQSQLTGPVELHQGGRAFIDRSPVFLPDDSGNYTRYWGLVSLLIDYETLVQDISSHVPAGLRIAIQNRADVSDADGSFVMGDPSILADAPMQAMITLPSTSWWLYCVPEGGWPTRSPSAGQRRAIGSVCIVLAALFAFLSVRIGIEYVQSVSRLRETTTQSQQVQRVLAKTARLARVGGWEYNTLSSEIVWSDEVCRIHDCPVGHKPTLDEAIGYYMADVQPIIRAAVQNSISLHQSFDLELPIVTAEGRAIWVRAVGEPEVVSGECVRLWGTCQDITELHEAQERLRLTQHAVNNAADAVFFIDQHGDITYANVAAGRYLGCSEEQLLTSTIFRVDINQTPQSWSRLWHRIKTDSYQTFSTQLVRQDGSTLDCDFSVSFVDFQGRELAVAHARDVSKAKHEAHLRSVLFEKSSDAHLIFDETGIIECNQAAVEMLRMTDKAELLAAHPAEFSPEFQPDGRRSLEKCAEMDAIAHKEGYHRFDWLHKRKDGEEFLCEVSLNHVSLDCGPALLVVWHDISERKKAEEELASSNKELQQFAYVASHDLQAPIRAVSNYAKFLNEDYSDHLDSQASQYIKRIVDGCKRMQNLIHDLLSYCRVEGRSKPLGVVDLNVVMEEVASIVRHSTQDLEPKITWDALPCIKGDSSQIVQLLLNLVDNGLKYHRENRPHVHVSASVNQNNATISVTDNGLGIPEDCQGKIFEIFKRLHSQEEYPGTGIGLAICKRIVERHQGKIWVESELGVGSAFLFKVPTSQSPEATNSGSTLCFAELHNGGN